MIRLGQEILAARIVCLRQQQRVAIRSVYHAARTAKNCRRQQERQRRKN